MNKKRKPITSSSVWRFLISQMFSLLGSTMADYVLIWYITIETGSGLMLALSMIVQFLPPILSAHILEKRIYKYDLKNLIMVSDIFIAGLAFVLAVAIAVGQASYPLFLTVLFFRAAGAGIQKPCEKAFVLQIASREELEKVNAANSIISSVSSLLAPALGGFLLASVSLSAALLLDLVTASIAVAILYFIKPKKAVTETAGESTVSRKIQLKNPAVSCPPMRSPTASARYARASAFIFMKRSGR